MKAEIVTEVTEVTEATEAQTTRSRQRPGSQPAQVVAAPRGGGFWTMVAAILLVALVGYGIWRHIQGAREQQDFARANAEAVVNVQTVRRNRTPIQLVLPGSIDANQAATLYARANGYLGKWYADIGDNVKKGQLLAEIETPDVEQQYRQAQGVLAQARSNFEIARATAVRWQELFSRKVVSAQDNDQEQSNYQAAAAAMSAAQANAGLLEQQLGFNRITAPFDGRITKRFLDIGALVSGGGSGGTQIYSLAETDPLLIYVYVPQSNAALIQPGLTARLLVREFPGRDFVATIRRTAGAIDPASRTLLTELQIPNREGVLYAGMYAEIQFSLAPGGNAPIVIPANAYIFRTEGPQVVVIRDGKAHWQTLQVGRDLGQEMEVLSGLREGDKVVVNPSDDIQEGETVTVKEVQPSPSPAAAAHSR